MNHGPSYPTLQPRIACVTSARLPELGEDDQPLLPALAERGLDARPVVWNDPEADWASYDAVVVRSPWDYPTQAEAFIDWYEKTSAVTELHNSLDVVRANQHKGYLGTLWERGVPAIPTATVGSPTEALAVARRHGWEQSVIKPAVGLGGRNVALLTPERAAELEESGMATQWCVQQFMPSIRTEGELSLVYVNGEASHAILKHPGDSDIRVHEGHGGRHAPYRVTDELREIGDQVLTACDASNELFARVDVVRDESGQLRLMELDVTSPCLYFLYCPSSVDVFADAVAARVHGDR
ncbi:hypothetical protein HHX38_16105 [Streptomyces sp. PKU-MA01144]|uniref:ATP-grasp domain-containing protein n=1 Tax=Streptomyces sp. PKU-MA01144 TaxID=2729138 RepID=UPI00147BD84B|nr:hypothetical protein [Streptomyces sp. PKU-MA01144]NNJ05649.1 hypothetical protein [Streptomyces sp. PKU-MA01144]